MDEILITGVSGGLANLVAQELAKEYRVVGVDVRPRRHREPFPGKFYRVRYQHRNMADVFRRHNFKILIHLGRIRNTVGRLKERFDLNVLGTRNLLDLCLKFELEQAIVMSTFHVYGAHQHNALYLNEESTLRASQIFPELADAVALDNVATAFLWRNRRIKTLIIRPANIIGPSIKNALSNLLRQRLAPYLMGFDPIMQFLHEQDAARALVLAVRAHRYGVYNLAGEGVVPYTDAITLAGGRPMPVPHLVAYPLVDRLARLGLRFPMHLLDYFKYPTVICDRPFRRDFDWCPEVDSVTALRGLERSS
jgi:UDP-glucose 4-epimerase